MTPQKQLVKEIIRSLHEEYENWEFNRYVAINKEWGIELRITNVPVLSLGLYRPTEVTFSLWDRFMIYRALSKCRALKIISLNKN